ncbi:MAG: hypothetical protein Tsb0020_51710 [Haliangiales bacterium]
MLSLALLALSCALVYLAWFTGNHKAGAGWVKPALIALACTAFPLALAAAGVTTRFEQRPPGMVFLVVPMIAAMAVMAFGSVGRRLIDALPIAAFAGYQGFRVPVELMLWSLYRDGVMPIQTTFEGYNYDILSGVFGLMIWIWARRAPPPRWLLWAYNALGLALLVTIVAIAIASTPTFAAFSTTPLVTAPMKIPYVLLPGVLVSAALFGHLVSFRALLRRT